MTWRAFKNSQTPWLTCWMGPKVQHFLFLCFVLFLTLSKEFSCIYSVEESPSCNRYPFSRMNSFSCSLPALSLICINDSVSTPALSLLWASFSRTYRKITCSEGLYFVFYLFFPWLLLRAGPLPKLHLQQFPKKPLCCFCVRRPPCVSNTSRFSCLLAMCLSDYLCVFG